MRQMLEKHTLENAELDDQLNRRKIDLVNKVIEDAEAEKNTVKMDCQSQLREALKNASDTDDKNAILLR